MKNFLKKHISIVFLAAVLLSIYIANSTPGTWLAGWDNLMPELNIFVNLKRSLQAVWVEYHGLGVVGGMGHATELIRQLFLLPFTLILPNNWIRYFWIFLLMGIGTFGMYYGLGKITKFSKIARTLSALFYLINFGSIQIFWPPFEPFIGFWAAYPWLIFYFINLMQSKKKKDLYIWLLINVLATPAFYLQTTFVVYLISIFGISLSYLLLNGNKKEFLIKNTKTYLILFLINSFWILPFLYFLLNNLGNPLQSTGNIMSTQETLMRNQKRGNIGDLLRLREYFFDFSDADQALMQSWQDHFNNNIYDHLSLILGLLSITGLFILILKFFKERKPYQLSFLYIFFIVCISMLSATEPFTWINQLMRNSAFLDQVFRSPFTKFVGPMVFSFSIFFGYFIQWLNKKFPQAKQVVFIFFTALIFITYNPIFKGDYIYSNMKVEIPQDYFELFEYFNNEPDKTTRIANLPQGNFWGWTIYRWGYRGSGFIWYGIEQPIMDRAYDVWGLENEQYYWELNYALQTQNINLVENVFDKYFVRYIIYDDNVIFPGEKEYARTALLTYDLLNKSKNISLIGKFGDISLFEFNNSTAPVAVDNITTSSEPFFSFVDKTYDDYGHYYSSNLPEVINPYGGLFTQRPQEEKEFSVEEDNDYLYVNSILPINISDNINSYSIESNRELENFSLPYKVDLDQVSRNKTTYKITPDNFTNSRACASKNQGSIDIAITGDEIIMKADEAVACIDLFPEDKFSKEIPFGIRIEYDYKSKNDEWPNSCLVNIHNGTCFEGNSSKIIGFSDKWTHYSKDYLIDPAKEMPGIFSLLLDAYNSESEKQIAYKNVYITVFDIVHNKIELTENQSVPVYIDNDQIVTAIKKMNSDFNKTDLISNNNFVLEPKSCANSKQGSYNLEYIKNTDNFARLSSIDNDSCLTWYFPQQPLDQGWLVKVEYRNVSNYPLLISGFDGFYKYRLFTNKLETDKDDWQTAYITVPALNAFDKGLGISLHNISLNQYETINEVKDISIYAIPWEYINSIKLTYGQITDQKKQILNYSGNVWHYSIQLDNAKGTLILPQSFDKGWIAITDNFKLLDHYEISNWANGWQIEGDPEKVYIIFWPQILQFIGFGALGLAILLVTSKKRLII